MPRWRVQKEGWETTREARKFPPLLAETPNDQLVGLSKRNIEVFEALKESGADTDLGGDNPQATKTCFVRTRLPCACWGTGTDWQLQYNGIESIVHNYPLVFELLAQKQPWWRCLT